MSFSAGSSPVPQGLALRVADVEAAREELLEKDIEPIYTIERFQFKEYYYHHDHFGGVMIALTEFPHGVETNVLAGQHENRIE